jgi:suppressor of tumorigenicity protein 13
MKEESDPESDVELELLDTVIEGDADADSQEMGDEGKEPTEEEMDQASDLRSKAAQAYSNQEFEGLFKCLHKQLTDFNEEIILSILEAVNCYTEAILLNPKNSLFYAKRGQVFLKMKKPNAAIRDCNRALQLNPDSAAAYKFRGRAQRLLGKWEEAAKDLRQACKLDFDDEADEWLKEVTPNAKKIEQHKIKQERKKTEKELNERRERVKRAQEANRRAEEERAKQEESAGGDFGGMPADFMEAFNDPEVAAALQDVMTNPANIMKYQNNPKVMNLLKKISGGMGGMPGMGGMGGMPGMGGMGGMPGMGGMGGMPGMGGMGGFPGFGGAAPNNDTPKSDSKSKDYDDGLD